jgi:aerobic-type carbon monoxide dehydrogenase small subunit (CoxS/CutS family)
MTTQHITVTVNGEAREADVEPRLLLVHLLRDVLGLTGTHIGCDTRSGEHDSAGGGDLVSGASGAQAEV